MPEFATAIIEVGTLVILVWALRFGIRRDSTLYGQGIQVVAGLLLIFAIPFVVMDMTVYSFYRKMRLQHYPYPYGLDVEQMEQNQPADALHPENGMPEISNLDTT